MSDLVGNPEDRFSHNEAHFNKMFLDPQGVAVQTHHVHTYSYTDNEEMDESATHQPTREVIEVYRNDPKFSDRLVWANSADLDQIASRGPV